MILPRPCAAPEFTYFVAADKLVEIPLADGATLDLLSLKVLKFSVMKVQNVLFILSFTDLE